MGITVSWSCVCLNCKKPFTGLCTAGIINFLICPSCHTVHNVYVPECKQGVGIGGNGYMENDPRSVIEPSGAGVRPM